MEITLGSQYVMKTLAFCLFKYFPYGGLERDMLQIALACQQRGWHIRVYTLSWEGPIPQGIDVRVLPRHGFSNHSRAKHFHAAVREKLQKEPVAGVVGFNKMPDLDVYYAADTCYREKAEHQNPLCKLLPRYRLYSAFEKAVFDKQSKTEILMISRAQEPLFKKYYDTPSSRMHYLPPNISRDRIAPPNANEIREKFRKEFAIKENDKLIILVGSGFQRKGVDRAIQAIASLPGEIRNRTHLFVLGKDRPEKFIRLSESLGIRQQTKFFGGRDDVPRFLLGADLLIHPARSENTGTVLLEAVASGLPVLCTAVCGYGFHIEKAQCGLLTPEPFSQKTLDSQLHHLLTQSDPGQLRRNALSYANAEDLYGMANRAAEIIDTTITAKLPLPL